MPISVVFEFEVLEPATLVTDPRLMLGRVSPACAGWALGCCNTGDGGAGRSRLRGGAGRSGEGGRTGSVMVQLLG